MTEKPKFVNTPPEQAEEAKKEIQKVERAEKRKLKNEPQITKKEWIQTCLFWGMAVYIVITVIILPIAIALKYPDENAFYKAHPDLVEALMTRKKNIDKETDCNLKKALDPFYKCE